MEPAGGTLAQRCDRVQAPPIFTSLASGDRFGRSVAVSGNTVVVGAWADRNETVGAVTGSAFVFVRIGGSWSQQAMLTASDAAAGDDFGYSVAVSGDTVVAGAPEDQDMGIGTGSAYVFVRGGESWSQQAKLTASDAAVGDRFGYSVAVSGNTVVAGAYFDDGVWANSGSAYVFVRSGGPWSQHANLRANDEADAGGGVRLGVSVAVSGGTAVAGAYLASSGAAYVFGPATLPNTPDAAIDVTLDVQADAQTDAEGPFYEATTADGSVTIRIRDLPPDSQRVDLRFTPIPPDQLGAFSPPDEQLLDQADGIPAAGEILLFDADSGTKIDATIEVILAPLNVADLQFLLWLVETPAGGLTPVEFTAELDGTLTARFAFDLIFIILDMPAPETNLRPGLNAVVYTGPQMPADRAFPGGPGRGAGIQALWRFTGVGFEAFFPAFPDLVVPTYRLYDPLFVVATGNGALMQQGLLVSVRRTVSLSGGDNLLSYTGAGGSILNVVDAAVVARARAIWIWRDSIGAWRGFFPGQPAAIQGITNLALGDIVFINISAAVGWDMR